MSLYHQETLSIETCHGKPTTLCVNKKPMGVVFSQTFLKYYVFSNYRQKYRNVVGRLFKKTELRLAQFLIFFL